MVSKVSGRTGKVRNKLESSIRELLGKDWKYEEEKLDYIQRKKYIPDFHKGKFIIEAKGYFRPEDRRKMLDVINYNIENYFLMILSHPDKTISKRSKTTYGEWCTKNKVNWVSLDYFKREHKKICLSFLTKSVIHGSIKTSRKMKNKA
jgi:hypothetical protein